MYLMNKNKSGERVVIPISFILDWGDDFIKTVDRILKRYEKEGRDHVDWFSELDWFRELKDDE